MLNLNKSVYEGVLRALAVIVAIGMMIISAQFSVDGFAFQSPDKLYIGWMLAIFLIIIEMIFNSNLMTATDQEDVKRTTILFIAGLAAYAYGIATNISGILHSGRTPDNFLDYIVPVALGLFLEIVPEPLVVLALFSGQRPTAKRVQAPQPQQAVRQYQPQTNQPRNKPISTSELRELYKHFPRKGE